MTILDRVRLFLRTKHVHDFRLHNPYGYRYRAICKCGVDGGPVDMSRWSVLYGLASVALPPRSPLYRGESL